MLPQDGTGYVKGISNIKAEKAPDITELRKSIPHLKPTRKDLRKCLLKASVQNYRKHEE